MDKQKLLNEVRNRIDREFGGHPIMGGTRGSLTSYNSEPFGITFGWDDDDTMVCVQLDIKVVETPKGWTR